jgi:class 3 adenylate cyclase
MCGLSFILFCGHGDNKSHTLTFFYMRALLQGMRRQFLVDDKGTTLIIVFGVPPFSHENDEYRSVKTAMELRNAFATRNVQASIGVATGNVFVGTVGSPYRKEHAVVGDTVNLSARLAARAGDGGILCKSHALILCLLVSVFFLACRLS